MAADFPGAAMGPTGKAPAADAARSAGQADGRSVWHEQIFNKKRVCSRTPVFYLLCLFVSGLYTAEKASRHIGL